MSEILDPQTRELYEALMFNGHFEEALELADTTESKLMDDHTYLDNKTATVKNLLIHNIAKALEAETCLKDPLPCDLCVRQARKIFPRIWEPLELFISKLEPFANISRWQMLDDLTNSLSVPAVPDTVGPKILKAPKKLEGDAHGEEWY